ncbi:uncharacterized protein LOC107496374 [Arachis duranensis]|uniref:Uncharacterized protein LOC107496374 n=1 Tax=Arachis duranensis TaxID=130453 RepID=A0A6P4DW05_ARADU|nr:uncharacterized protein LOC107496374 [Arachis duranensis]
MDSLLASYASSDEEEDEQQQQKLTAAVPSKTTSSSSSAVSSLFSSLPQPKSSSSSLFQSLPQPNQHSVTAIHDNDDTSAPSSSKFTGSSSLFTSLPKPKSQIQPPQPQPKKVVQFRPPTIPISRPSAPDDDDDEDEEEERNRRRKMASSIQAPSVKSFLSSIPAPRNSATLGVQSSSGSGRRSIIETEAPASEPEPEPEPAMPSSSGVSDGGVVVDQNSAGCVNYESYSGYQYGSDQNAGSSYYMDGGASYGGYGAGYDQSSGFQPEDGVPGTAGYGNGDGAYANYGAYADYGNNWSNGSSASVTAEPLASGPAESAAIFPKKRGRNEIPSEIIEVKQDELIKNRPREDQVKLTGIAFGPSYQPVSTKGKPSKLHKRKHQIGSLYFDMKQNEMKLAERRAKGMLTKAETQAKYGW